MTKGNRKKPKGSPKDLRNAAIMAEAATGKSTYEIADKLGVTRQTVSKVLKSDDAKALVDEVQARLAALIPECLETIEEAIRNRALDMPLAVSTAKDVIKNFGGMQSKVEVDHKFPRPVVIQRLNGTTVILGTMADAKGEEEE